MRGAAADTLYEQSITIHDEHISHAAARSARCRLRCACCAARTRMRQTAVQARAFAACTRYPAANAQIAYGRNRIAASDAPPLMLLSRRLATAPLLPIMPRQNGVVRFTRTMIMFAFTPAIRTRQEAYCAMPQRTRVVADVRVHTAAPYARWFIYRINVATALSSTCQKVARQVVDGTGNKR